MPFFGAGGNTYRRYAPDMIILKTRSEVKVRVTPKWYTTYHHPNMHPYTKFGIPTSQNKEDTRVVPVNRGLLL